MHLLGASALTVSARVNMTDSLCWRKAPQAMQRLITLGMVRKRHTFGAMPEYLIRFFDKKPVKFGTTMSEYGLECACWEDMIMCRFVLPCRFVSFSSG